MPTLEDVFLNVSAETHAAISHKNIEGEHAAAKFDDFADEQLVDLNLSKCTKFMIDLKCSIKKRLLQIIRDKKSFVLEILCPILLVLIGLGVSTVQFNKNSPTIYPSLNLLPNPESIIINSNMFNNNTLPTYFQGLTASNSYVLNATFVPQTSFVNAADLPTTFINFNNVINTINNTANGYGDFYIFSANQTSQKYNFLTFVDTQSRNAPIIYTQYMINLIHNYATGKNINVNFAHDTPFPFNEPQLKTTKPDSRNYFNP